jgi:hypothetical protein
MPPHEGHRRCVTDRVAWGKTRATLNLCSAMANLTISVDEQLLKRARLRALSEGTSVNRLLRERLESYVEDGRRRRRALKELLQLSRSARSGSAGRKVGRDDVYE